MIGIGRYENALLNNRSDISNANRPTKNDEYLLVAPVFILSDVLMKTAVAGNPPNNHDPIFASQFPNTSLSLSNFCPDSFSAIFPEIIVSKIVTIATTLDTFKIPNKRGRSFRIVR